MEKSGDVAGTGGPLRRAGDIDREAAALRTVAAHAVGVTLPAEAVGRQAGCLAGTVLTTWAHRSVGEHSIQNDEPDSRAVGMLTGRNGCNECDR